MAGGSVALSANGARLAVGAALNDGNGANSGHARVFEYTGAAWTQIGADIDGEAADDRSGSSISLSANGARLAVGAPLNDGNGADSGHARVFEYTGAAWTQIGADIDGEAAYDYSGTSVALSENGGRLAVGAPRNGGFAGHVRVFEFDGATWNQLGTDIDGEAAGDQSGTSVALSADGTRLANSAATSTARRRATSPAPRSR